MGKGKFGTIVQIGDILVSEDVVTEYFACDYGKCRGACCIIGDSGAPMEEDETDLVEREYPEFKDLMRPQGREATEKKGFFDPDGECLCAIEMRGLKKPVSCSLYPIRVTRLTGGGLALNLHRWEICSDAFEKGRREHIRVYEFLRKPLTERFGEEFYEALSAAAKHLRG